MIETYYYNLLRITVSNTHLCLSPFCVSEALCRFRHVAWAAWAIAILRALAKKVLTGYDYMSKRVYTTNIEKLKNSSWLGEVGVQTNKQTKRWIKKNKEHLIIATILFAEFFLIETKVTDILNRKKQTKEELRKIAERNFNVK